MLGQAPTRDWKIILSDDSFPLFTMQILKLKTMSHHNASANFSHELYKRKGSLVELDREIEMGELRLRYIQLMRDFYKTLGEEDAINLIKESEGIWEKLTS